MVWVLGFRVYFRVGGPRNLELPGFEIYGVAGFAARSFISG